MLLLTCRYRVTGELRHHFDVVIRAVQEHEDPQDLELQCSVSAIYAVLCCLGLQCFLSDEQREVASSMQSCMGEQGACMGAV